jgi:hypothetical protein
VTQKPEVLPPAIEGQDMNVTQKPEVVPHAIGGQETIINSEDTTNEMMSTKVAISDTDRESDSVQLGLEEKEKEFVLYVKEVKNAIQDMKIRKKRFRKWICGCGFIQV